MWVRMFFTSICGYSCCLLTVLLPPLCFSQAQRNKRDISPVCFCSWASVKIYRPGWLWLQFMSFWSSPESQPKAYDVPFFFFLLLLCIYLLNTSSTVQEQQCSRLKLPLVYLVVMINFSRGCHSDDKHPLASVVCLLVLLCLHLPLLPQRGVFISSVTCCCKSNNEIQEPFVPIRFPNPTKCSLETGLITWHDPQSR